MFKKIRINLLLLGLVSSVFVGCNKEEDRSKVDTSNMIAITKLTNAQDVTYMKNVNSVSVPKTSDIKEDKPSSLLSLTIEDENGKKMDILDFSKGKPTILVFYTSWCGDCRAMLPILNEFVKNEKEVTFVFVNPIDNTRETLKSGRDYVRDSKYAFQYLHTKAEDAMSIYKLKKIPLVMGFDKNGNTKDYLIESFTKEEVQNLINMVK